MPQVHDYSPETSRMRDDVLKGLRQQPKHFPSQYLYDDRGARLFERICELDEYYLTRTENAIIAENIAHISQRLGPQAILIEPGSGAGEKALTLLSHMPEPAAYVPIDVARDQLAEVAVNIDRTHTEVDVVPICADFTHDHDLPIGRIEGRRRVVFFPGSTIGNFARDAARELLSSLAELAEPGGGVLIGVDLKKDRAILEAAYDDAEGVSAEFAKNILVRLNRELDAGFEISQFDYEAPYNADAGRIEMALVSRRAQSVRINGDSVTFARGERIRTEFSYKYEPHEFADLAGSAGLRVLDVWTDADRLFSVQYLEPQS